MTPILFLNYLFSLDFYVCLYVYIYIYIICCVSICGPESDILTKFIDSNISSYQSINVVLKVIWENKQGLADELPHLVYISREKRAKHPHHYKAGAMNVLVRISFLLYIYIYIYACGHIYQMALNIVLPRTESVIQLIQFCTCYCI